MHPADTDSGPDGAGVDISTSPFWLEALPPNNFSWTVVPSGRTSWARNFSYLEKSYLITSSRSGT